MKPLCIDIFCGLGGWTDGFLAEGWRCIGFDIEHHVYGQHRYPAQLVIQDARTIHGKQFKDADMIVASSPCQAYSYMAMPWTRAKQIARALRGADVFPDEYTGPRTIDDLNELFLQPARIQREACEAAGRYIPMIQENVRGAIPWVGRSNWHYGSFHLWGDVPALMPTTMRGVMKQGVAHRSESNNFHQGKYDGAKNPVERATKNTGGSWFNVAHNTTSGHANNARDMLAAEGRKQPGISGTRENGKGDRWFQDGAAASGSKSSARKAASARIAMIPDALARHIARTFYPSREAVA